MNRLREEILKVNETRKHKVTNSRGVYDAYKYIRKNKWLNLPRAVTEHEFYSIIRGVNKLLAESLLNSEDIIFPHRMGQLELRKYNPKVYFSNGKLITNLPIDWNKTLELWTEDEECYNNKTLIRAEEKEIFKVLYNRNKANYENKSFMQFLVNRDIKRKLAQKIKNKSINAFVL